MRKTPCGGQFQGQILTRAEAGVNVQDDREWQFRFFVEDRDFLQPPIFEELKVIFVQVCDRGPALVRDRHEHIDQFHVHLDRVVVFRRSGFRHRLHPWGLRNAPGTLGMAHGDRQQCYEQNFHRWTIHLDAGVCGLVTEAGDVISAGKGSPSAHTAPSSKCSFFQMGTVFLSVSMSQRHASKAAARCADLTTTSNTTDAPSSGCLISAMIALGSMRSRVICARSVPPLTGGNKAISSPACSTVFGFEYS